MEWDVIVIGTGPSGATVAKELASKNKKVLILEKGKPDLTMNIPKMLLNKEMMFLGKGKTLVRGIRTGGTSILYYGTAYDPPQEPFLSFGIDLTKEVEKIKSEIPVNVLPDCLIGPVATRIMKSAVDLGYSWGKLQKFIYPDLCTSHQFEAESQWNSLKYLKKAMEQGAILYTGANVKRILMKQQEAVGVEYVSEGKIHQVCAAKIVLSAGGYGSPIILQASGIKRAGEGFFCDPVVVVQGIIEGLMGGNEIPMTTGVVCKEDGYLMTDITLPQIVYQMFAAQRFRLDRIFDHSQTISVMIKVKDDIGGGITAEGKVLKHFNEKDRLKMKQGITKATEILEHAGANKIFRTEWTSAHPGGSVRIGDLVDANLETEYKNLYVCDCSVIPSAWGLPPVLTLLALARRLSKHLL